MNKLTGIHSLSRDEQRIMRYQQITEWYTKGVTMQEMANRLHLTRSRIQQIVTHNLGLPGQRNIHEPIVYTCNKCSCQFKSNEGNFGWSSVKGGAVGRCMKCVAVSKQEHEEYWSYKHKLMVCIDCHSSDRKHQWNGRCTACATRFYFETSPQRREKLKIATKKWYDNNRERAKENMSKYSKEYSKRPYVKEKAKKALADRMKDPEYVAKMKAYWKEYNQRPEVKEHKKISSKTNYII